MAELQSRIYFFLDELQKMAQDITPRDLQQRIPNETLSGLASSLAEGQIFEIIDGLTEVQQETEKKLFRERLELQRRISDEKSNFVRLYQDNINKSSGAEVLEMTNKMDKERTVMNARHQEEIRQFDIGVILQLDQKVSEQQVTLEKVGLPGFYVTNNPKDVQVQICLLQMILKLKKIDREKDR